MPLSLLRRQLLTEPSLNHIRHHKYKGGDYTHLDTFLNPWWNWCANAMPLWLAPNTITLIGLISVLSTVVVAALSTTSQNKHERGSLYLPAAAHLFIAFIEFFYQTADAVDGKQARRTNSGSPLGQLFDHGCDAIVAAVLIHHLCNAVGLGGTLYHPLILVLGLSVFYLAQFEETVTGVLRTNVGQVGVTEAQVIAMAVHLIVAWSGPAIFTRPVASLLPMAASYVPPSLSLGEAIGAFVIVGISLAGAAVIFKAVVTSTMSMRRTLLPAMPTFILGGATIAIFVRAAFLPALDVRGGRQTCLGRELPGLVLLTYAISQIHLSTKTIVFGMAKQQFTPFQLMSLTVPLLLCLDILDTGLAQASSALILLLTALGYCSLVSSFVLQISHALGIKVFKVRPMEPSEVIPHAGEAPTTVPPAGTFFKPGTVRTVELEVPKEEQKEGASTLRMRVKSGLVPEDKEDQRPASPAGGASSSKSGRGSGSGSARSDSAKRAQPGGSSTIPSGGSRRRTSTKPPLAASPSPLASPPSSRQRREGSQAGTSRKR